MDCTSLRLVMLQVPMQFELEMLLPSTRCSDLILAGDSSLAHVYYEGEPMSVEKDKWSWNMYTEEKIEVAGQKKQERNALFEAGKYARASQRECIAPIAHSEPLPHYLDKVW